MEGIEAPALESAEAKHRRIAREAADLARARESVAASRLVDSAKVRAWIDSTGTDHELPTPYSGN